MPIRTLLFALIAVAASAQVLPTSRLAETLDGPALQAAQKSNPDDANTTSRLLRFYATDNHDPDWSNRFALLTWNIQHHPDATFLLNQFTYQEMPKTLRDQLKPLWVAQVHQHADDPRVLRGAAACLDTAPQAIRVGANVQSANLIRQVKPEYPQEARQARIEGTVRYNATIGPDGYVKNLQLVSGHPLLVTAATTAVQQWVYKPTLLNGSPVSVTTALDVNFTLQP